MDNIKLCAKNIRELESLLHTVRVFSEDIGMDFSVKTCVMLKMNEHRKDDKVKESNY